MQIYVFLNAVRLEADFACVLFLLFLMVQTNAGIQAFPSKRVSEGLHGAGLQVIWTDMEGEEHKVFILVSFKFVHRLRWYVES